MTPAEVADDLVSGTDSQGASGADLADAWSLLLDSADVIADSITLTIFERDADLYDGIGSELRTDLRASARQHIGRGLEILAGRADADTLGVGLWRETGRRRAQQGVPLELVLHSYTLGARMLWEALVNRASGAGGLQISDRVLLIAARTVWSNLDVQNAVVVDAYRRESDRLQRQDLQRQQAVLDALLAGRGADPEYAKEARSVLGISPDQPVAALVVLHDRDAAPEMAALEERLDRAGIGVFWHLRAGGYFGLIHGALPTEMALADLIDDQAPGRVGVALAAEGVAGFPSAYALAARAAETLGRSERRAVSVRARLPEVLLVGSPELTPLLLAETIAPLLRLPDAQRDLLLQTLAALLRRDGSPTHAATDLFCHRNTVIYRLKQIESLTGRSLTDPRDKLLLKLGLVASGLG